MDNLKIDITSYDGAKPGKTLPLKAILFIVLILVFILLLPVLLVIVLIVIGIRMFSPKSDNYPPNKWTVIRTNSNLELSWIWTNVDDVPELLHQYFDPHPLMEFRTNVPIPFFDGYFTSFNVERDDGIFVQKVEMSESGVEIEALPLYFFSYQTLEVERIVDLKDYTIDQHKGNPDDFIVYAYNGGGELEIRLTK